MNIPSVYAYALDCTQIEPVTVIHTYCGYGHNKSSSAEVDTDCNTHRDTQTQHTRTAPGGGVWWSASSGLTSKSRGSAGPARGHVRVCVRRRRRRGQRRRRLLPFFEANLSTPRLAAGDGCRVQARIAHVLFAMFPAGNAVEHEGRQGLLPACSGGADPPTSTIPCCSSCETISSSARRTAVCSSSTLKRSYIHASLDGKTLLEEGSVCIVENKSLPKATYTKLQPRENEFIRCPTQRPS